MTGSVRGCFQKDSPLAHRVGRCFDRISPTRRDGDVFTWISESPNSIVRVLLQHHLVAEQAWQTHICNGGHMACEKQSERSG